MISELDIEALSTAAPKTEVRNVFVKYIAVFCTYLSTFPGLQ